MAIRKASAYSKKPNRPFTRKSSRKSKAYIKTVPYSKIVKLRMGDQKSFEENKHKYNLYLVAEEGVLIRDNALESGRMLLHKLLESEAPGMYFMEVKVYPHHMLRENKTAAGAGADRMSTGMTQSFGIVQLGSFIKTGSPVQVRQYQWDNQQAKYKVAIDFRQRTHFTGKLDIDGNELNTQHPINNWL